MTKETMIVLTTCGNDDDARALAQALVERRAAACVNAVSKVASTYRWKGKVQQDQETLLIIKTTTARLGAVEGTIRERDVGQKTTLDVLNAQAELTSAREALISASASRVIASFALLAAAGRLSAPDLGLNVAVHSADGYIATVEDVWQELRAIDE